MTEQEYDDLIAPMLEAVAQKVADLGGKMVARVEWKPFEAGVTLAPPSPEKMESGSMVMAAYACLCRGNADSLFIKLARMPGAQDSLVLRGLAQKLDAMN
jgi:hypothetical protein